MKELKERAIDLYTQAEEKALKDWVASVSAKVDEVHKLMDHVSDVVDDKTDFADTKFPQTLADIQKEFEEETNEGPQSKIHETLNKFKASAEKEPPKGMTSEEAEAARTEAEAVVAETLKLEHPARMESVKLQAEAIRTPTDEAKAAAEESKAQVAQFTQVREGAERLKIMADLAELQYGMTDEEAKSNLKKEIGALDKVAAEYKIPIDKLNADFEGWHESWFNSRKDKPGYDANDMKSMAEEVKAFRKSEDIKLFQNRWKEKHPPLLKPDEVQYQRILQKDILGLASTYQRLNELVVDVNDWVGAYQQLKG